MIVDVVPEVLSGARKKESEPQSQNYLLAQTTTHVQAAEPRWLRPIEEILSFYRNDKGSRDREIVFELVRDDHRPANFEASLKPVYRSKAFSCWERSPAERWLEIPGEARVWCDLDENRAIAFIDKMSDPLPWTIGHYVFFPMWVQMLKKAGLHHIHAACVSKNGKGILMPGASGCGKSTLTLNLVRRGFDFLCDDTVFLEHSGESVSARGLYEPAKIHTQSAKLFPELDFIQSQLTVPDRSKIHLPIDQIFDGCGRTETTNVQLLIFPEFTGGPETKIKPLAKADALASLFDFCLFPADPYSSTDQLRILGDLVEPIRCFEAQIGRDNDESASRLNELLEETVQ